MVLMTKEEIEQFLSNWLDWILKRKLNGKEPDRQDIKNLMEQLSDLGVVIKGKKGEKVCQACPDRFEGCSQVAPLIDRELPFNIDTNKLIASMSKEEQDYIDRYVNL